MELLTLGYQGFSLDLFVETLVGAGVELVHDVRQVPWSHKRGFSRSSLSLALSVAGIGYVHVGELGCPQSIRKAFKVEADWDAYVRRYRQHLASQADAIERIQEVLKHRRSCLLCFEADAYRCHRSLIAEALCNRTNGGVDVVHLVIPQKVAQSVSPAIVND